MKRYSFPCQNPHGTGMASSIVILMILPELHLSDGWEGWWHGQVLLPPLGAPLHKTSLYISAQSSDKCRPRNKTVAAVPPSEEPLLQQWQQQAGIFSLKHESSIFRSVIQPCMWFLIGSLQLVPQLLGTYKTTDRVGWMIWIYYSRALERRCLATTLIGHPQIPLVELICCHSYSYIHTWNK